MTTTAFVNGVTLSDAGWANDVDTASYNYLTALSGQNTLSGTGPTSMTAYAAGQVFRFLPVSSNTISTTLNVVANSVSLGAKNILWGGAALAGGEIRAGVPALVQYDGSAFSLLNKSFNQNSPTFHAYTSLATAMATTTFTKILFNVEEWDDNSNFDSATNYRFTPTVPGKYYFDAVATLSAVNNQKFWLLGVFKNGSLYRQGPICINGAGGVSEVSAGISGTVSMNGTTDYLEVYGYNTDVSQVMNTASTKSLFTAFRMTA